MTTAEFADYAKLFVALIAAFIFLVGFIAPIRGTLVPYWREHGKPSSIMLGRVGTRFFLFLLAFHEAVFPLNRVLGMPVSSTVLVIIVIPILMVLSTLFLYSCIKHPQGISGL